VENQFSRGGRRNGTAGPGTMKEKKCGGWGQHTGRPARRGKGPQKRPQPLLSGVLSISRPARAQAPKETGSRPIKTDLMFSLLLRRGSAQLFFAVTSTKPSN